MRMRNAPTSSGMLPTILVIAAATPTSEEMTADPRPRRTQSLNFVAFAPALHQHRRDLDAAPVEARDVIGKRRAPRIGGQPPQALDGAAFRLGHASEERVLKRGERVVFLGPAHEAASTI